MDKIKSIGCFVGLVIVAAICGCAIWGCDRWEDACTITAKTAGVTAHIAITDHWYCMPIDPNSNFHPIYRALVTLLGTALLLSIAGVFGVLLRAFRLSKQSPCEALGKLFDDIKLPDEGQEGTVPQRPPRLNQVIPLLPATVLSTVMVVSFASASRTMRLDSDTIASAIDKSTKITEIGNNITAVNGTAREGVRALVTAVTDSTEHIKNSQIEQKHVLKGQLNQLTAIRTATSTLADKVDGAGGLMAKIAGQVEETSKELRASNVQVVALTDHIARNETFFNYRLTDLASRAVVSPFPTNDFNLLDRRGTLAFCQRLEFERRFKQDKSADNLLQEAFGAHDDQLVSAVDRICTALQAGNL